MFPQNYPRDISVVKRVLSDISIKHEKQNLREFAFKTNNKIPKTKIMTNQRPTREEFWINKLQTWSIRYQTLIKNIPMISLICD